MSKKHANYYHQYMSLSMDSDDQIFPHTNDRHYSVYSSTLSIDYIRSKWKKDSNDVKDPLKIVLALALDILDLKEQSQYQGRHLPKN